MVDGRHLWFHLLTMVMIIKALDQEKTSQKIGSMTIPSEWVYAKHDFCIRRLVVCGQWLQELLWLKKSSTGCETIEIDRLDFEKKKIHELKLDQKPTISSVVPYSPTNVPVRDSWWWPIASNKGTALRQEKDLPGPVVNPLGIPRIPNVDKPTMPGDGMLTLTWGWFMTVNPTWNTMF